MKRVFKVLMLLALVLAMLMLTGCGDRTPGARGEGYRDTLVVIIDAEPSTLFPHETLELHGMFVLRKIFNQLVARTNDEAQTIIPEVAERWEFLDATTIRFWLRDNIYFSNGDRMTAEDVQFSLELANRNPRVHFAGQLDRVDIICCHIVDVHTAYPTAALFSSMSSPRSGSIISRRHFEEVGVAGYARNPIGTGPYKLVEWIAGDRIVLRAREEYTTVGQSPPGLTPYLVFRFVPEPLARSVELETGAADIIMTPDFNDLDRLESLGFVIAPTRSYMITQADINTAAVPDIRIRQALAYAINYPALVDAIFGNMGTVAEGFLPAIMPGFTPDWNVRYNPERARQLVAEANIPGGVNLDMVVSNFGEDIQLAEVLQFFWRQAGINVNLIVGANAYILDRFFNGNFAIRAHTYSWGTGDPSRASFHYSIQPRIHNLSPADFREIDAIYQEALAEVFDEERRWDLYRQLYEVVARHWITIPIANRKIAYALSPNVTGFVASPTTRPDLMFVRVRY